MVTCISPHQLENWGKAYLYLERKVFSLKLFLNTIFCCQQPNDSHLNLHRTQSLTYPFLPDHYEAYHEYRHKIQSLLTLLPSWKWWDRNLETHRRLWRLASWPNLMKMRHIFLPALQLFQWTVKGSSLRENKKTKCQLRQFDWFNLTKSIALQSLAEFSSSQERGNLLSLRCLPRVDFHFSGWSSSYLMLHNMVTNYQNI